VEKIVVRYRHGLLMVFEEAIEALHEALGEGAKGGVGNGGQSDTAAWTTTLGGALGGSCQGMGEGGKGGGDDEGGAGCGGDGGGNGGGGGRSDLWEPTELLSPEDISALAAACGATSHPDQYTLLMLAELLVEVQAGTD
jgi:hypothetical protein